MSVLTVKGRDAAASRKNKRMRDGGMLPMALVDRDHRTILLQGEEVDLKRAMSHADGLGRLDLQVEGESKPRKVMLKHVDKDYIRHQILHVTFQEVRESDTVKIDLPVVAAGIPQQVEDGQAIIVQPTDHVKVSARMRDLPDRFEVDVTVLDLENRHAITAGELELPKGVKLISSPDATIFSVQLAKEPTLVIEEPEEVEDLSAAQSQVEGEGSGGENG